MKKILPEMQEILSEKGLFVRWLSVERALAAAQASLKLIPEQAAEDIMRRAWIEGLDLEQYEALYEKTGHPMVAMLRLLEQAVGEESGQYLHLGATTQDIVDTGMMLAIRELLERAEERLRTMLRSACRLAVTYADTPMMGRTHNIQALPITFGYKAAVWADELGRCLERLRESRERILVLQLSGAVGSMVSFGENGQAIQQFMAEELSLSLPNICWHASRDRYVEFADQMALIGCTLGRIAQEIYLLMGTEFGELSEYWGEGRVGSSTMPHKVNPTSVQHMRALAMHLRYHASQIGELALVDHERDMQHFIGERKLLEEICLYTAELLDRGDELLKTLVVRPERMKQNMELLGGLTQSEHVMLALGRKIGKQRAHQIVNEVAVRAFQEQQDFEQELCRDDRVGSVLSAEELHELLDPMQYIGQCPRLARETAARWKQILGEADGWITARSH